MILGLLLFGLGMIAGAVGLTVWIALSVCRHW